MCLLQFFLIPCLSIFLKTFCNHILQGFLVSLPNYFIHVHIKRAVSVFGYYIRLTETQIYNTLDLWWNIILKLMSTTLAVRFKFGRSALLFSRMLW